MRMSMKLGTVLGGAGYLFDQTAFTQSLGAELLTNPGNPFTFTTDDPTGWTVGGEVASDPMVNEVGAGEGHGGAGTGYVNLYSSATTNAPSMTQPSILTVGHLVEMIADLNFRASGTFAMGTNAVRSSYTTIGVKEQVLRISNTTANIGAAGVAPHDFTLKSVSYKRITPNANQTHSVNADIRMTLALPGSPSTGQQVGFWFRMPSPSGTPFTDGNYVYIQRNNANDAWDVRTDRYTTNTGTNIAALGATGIGTPNALRVVCSGDNISVYTSTGGIDGTWTQRGSTTAVTQNNTGTLAAAFASSALASGITEFRAQAA